MENNYNRICELFDKIGGKDGLYEPFFYTNDYPVPYKNLKIYPITTDLYQVFHVYVECLILDEEHKQGGNKEAIKLSYLDYLYYKARNNDNAPLYMLLRLLEMCLHLDKYMITDECNKIPTVDYLTENDKLLIRIENDVYDSKDFDKIRKIICEQNCVEMPDLTIHPDIKKLYKEQDDFARKKTKSKVCSFDEMKSRITGRTGITKNIINSMSIREFTQLLESLERITSYDLTMVNLPDIDKKYRNKIPHWTDGKDEDKYAKYRTDMTAYAKENKIEIKEKK